MHFLKICQLQVIDSFLYIVNVNDFYKNLRGRGGMMMETSKGKLKEGGDDRIERKVEESG